MLGPVRLDAIDQGSGVVQFVLWRGDAVLEACENAKGGPVGPMWKLAVGGFRLAARSVDAWRGTRDADVARLIGGRQ
jgi:hypothetical protein